MANFTWEIKRELLSMKNSPCCAQAELSALLAAGGNVFAEEGVVQFISENERIAERFMRLANEVCGVRPEVVLAELDKKRERDKLTLACTGGEAERLLRAAAHPFDRERPCCRAAAARGAFLGGGSCTVPKGEGKTGYHLEFVLKEEALADRLSELLSGLEVLGKQVKRGDKTVVYLKSRDLISDFLFVTGAEGALRKLEQLSAARDVSNNLNRVSNCDAGNADRSAIASAAQVHAFEELKERGVLSVLPEALQETARVRIQHPTLSLAELAAKLNISKSCLNHRMRKLMQIHSEKSS